MPQPVMSYVFQSTEGGFKIHDVVFVVVVHVSTNTFHFIKTDIQGSIYNAEML